MLEAEGGVSLRRIANLPLILRVASVQDWPPSTDFKTAFPELFDDFSRATPVPNYVRRDGVLNVASHFPSNTIAPDLGAYTCCFRLSAHHNMGCRSQDVQRYGLVRVQGQ